MSDSTSPTESTPSASSSTGAVSSASAGSSSNVAAFVEANASTKVSSMADLQKKAPELAEAIKEGIAFRIIRDMKEHNKRLKEIMEDQRRNSGQA